MYIEQGPFIQIHTSGKNERDLIYTRLKLKANLPLQSLGRYKHKNIVPITITNKTDQIEMYTIKDTRTHVNINLTL